MNHPQKGLSWGHVTHFRLHRIYSLQKMRVVTTDGVAWSVLIGHVREPYKNGWSDRDAVWRLTRVSLNIGGVDRDPLQEGAILGRGRGVKRYRGSVDPHVFRVRGPHVHTFRQLFRLRAPLFVTLRGLWCGGVVWPIEKHWMSVLQRFAQQKNQ